MWFLLFIDTFGKGWKVRRLYLKVVRLEGWKVRRLEGPPAGQGLVIIMMMMMMVVVVVVMIRIMIHK